MKTKRLVLAFILVISMMNVPLLKADTVGGGPQDTNDIRKKCPQGYVRVNGKCVPIQTNFADPNQYSTTNEVGSFNDGDIEDGLLIGIVNGVLFYVFGSIG